MKWIIENCREKKLILHTLTVNPTQETNYTLTIEINNKSLKIKCPVKYKAVKLIFIN